MQASVPDRHDVHVAIQERHGEPTAVFEWSPPVDYWSVRPRWDWLYEHQLRTDGAWGELVREDWTGGIIWNGEAARIRIVWDCEHNYMVGRWVTFYGEPTCPGCR